MGQNKSVFSIFKSRVSAGILLAIAVFGICLIWYDLKCGIVFSALFLAAGFVKLPLRHNALRFLVNAAWAVGCILLSCVAPTVMVSDKSFLDIGVYRVAMNLLSVAVIYGVCLALTGEIKKAVRLASLLLLLLATLNSFIFQFRGNEFKPTDIYATKTALNVAGQYTFRIRDKMAYCWFLWLWNLFALGMLPSSEGLIPRRWLRVLAAAASAACVALLIYGMRDIRPNNWSNEGTETNGYYLNFAVGIRDAIIKKPDGYDLSFISGMEAQYAGEEAGPDTAKKPNIVVIMSESYADFGILGDGLRTNQPVSPFIDSLTENTVKGYALTSIFGGVTANAEFEFLTGNTMAFLPEGSVPYQQYLHSDCFSLARVLENQGYTSFATHPYFSSGWSRTTVYPYFGFSDFTFVEDYPQQDYVRDYISDREMYDYVMSALENKDDSPMFLFGITMQNHGDYIYTGDNYEQTVFLQDYEMEHPMAEQYLSLLLETDKATEGFLNRLEELEEDTLVLFFGDHFPHVEGNFFRDVHGGDFETLEEQMLQYTIPFFIWANYDIPEMTVECTSLNYLARYLLEAAGLSLPPYYRFLAELEKEIPAVNALGYYSRREGTFLPLEDAAGEEAEWLNRYRMVQYNNLFDPDHRSETFFDQYIP